jgi:hypothetical protein
MLYVALCMCSEAVVIPSALLKNTSELGSCGALLACDCDAYASVPVSLTFSTSQKVLSCDYTHALERRLYVYRRKKE